MNPFWSKMGGVPLHTWLMMVLAFVPNTESITDAEKMAIRKGLETGKEIFGFIKEHKFQETLTKVSISIGSFLGVLGPFVTLVLTFVPSEDSAELTFMKDMMKAIDTHFDRMDSEFNEVKRLIDWTDVAVKFGVIQQNIDAMDAEYRLLYASSAPADNSKHVFLTAYENTYQLSGTKLYQAIVTKQGTFNEDLGQSVMRYTKNDRKKTQAFLLGIMEIVLQAVRIELAYYEMKGFKTVRIERKEEWEKRILQMKSKYVQIDKNVSNKYHEQSKADILEYANGNDQISNDQFSTGVYNMLVKKYYWREWFVLIYDPITGSKKHRMNVCAGHIFLEQNGRNIVTASKDKTATKMDLRWAKSEMNKFSVGYKELVDLGFGLPHLVLVLSYQEEILGKTNNAELIFDKANKASSCSFAVVKYNANVYYKASQDRLAFRDMSPYFKIFMFG